MTPVTFKEKALRFREDAIVEAVNRLLVSKGYDLMTVDEVAAEAGLAKASLYKHFTSKEELAGAAMVRILDRALAQVEILKAAGGATAAQQLVAVVRWTLQMQLAGQMPSLPAQNSKLVASLQANRNYTDRLINLSDALGAWITEAQQAGDIHPGFPPEMVLYSFFARACDPVLGLLKASKTYNDEQLIDWLLAATFQGLAAPASAAKSTKAAAKKVMAKPRLVG
jgi:AcrR family transcriptional regulator